tara:strand:- start:159 stop:488 length:330 start_codon:yes stop_codon:yes gene_type:complete
MKITVVHKAFEDTPQIVAEVEAPHAVVEEALEYAYRWTNNVMGSWSIKKKNFEDGEPNGDFNPNVKVVADLHIDESGKAWGLRSTSVRDMMHVDGRSFEVAGFGFTELV